MVARYVYTPASSSSPATSTLTYVHTSYLGTPVLETDQKGDIVYIALTDINGNAILRDERNDSTLQNKLYTGHKYDNVTQLTYAHARYLDTRMHTFTSVDPMYYQLSSAQLYNPQLMNAYSYANNNTVSNTDPTGLSFMSSITSAYNNVVSSTKQAYNTTVNYATQMYNNVKSNVVGGVNAVASSLGSYNTYVGPTYVSPNSSKNITPKTYTNTTNNSVAIGTSGVSPMIGPVAVNSSQGGSQSSTTWDTVTNNRIATLDSRVQQPAIDFINNVQSQLGITLRVGDAYRSIDLQNSIYEEGRSKPGTIKTRAKGGKSYHNYGLAIDVYFSENGETKVNKLMTSEVADIGKSLGFEWGGDWKKGKDFPHFEMSFGNSVDSLYKDYLKSK